MSDAQPTPGGRGVGASARWGFWAGPLLALLIWALPTPADLSPVAHRLAAVTVWMATWWMSEAVPVAATAMLPLALFPLLGIASAKAVAPNYGHDLVWLFFGGFQLAFAIEGSGLHRRMALGMVRAVGTRPDRLVLGFMLAVGLLSMWLLNTSTTLMMLPVGMAVAAAIEGGGEPGPFGKALMLGIAYGASVGGMGTLIGTAPNGIFVGVAQKQGVAVSFGQWMGFAAPLALLLIALIWLYLTRVAFRLPRGELPADHPARAALAQPPGPWAPAEKRVAAVFGLAVLGWLTRPLIASSLALPKGTLTDTTIAMAAAVALFLVPTPGPDGERGHLLTWQTSLRTPWHILLLFGGGFALAAGFESTHLSRWMGGQLALLIDGWPIPLVVLAAVLFVTFLTEVTSNTATATVLLPVIGGLATAMGEPVLLLMVPATLAASCAFMLPVATPPNAIVYASGLVRLPEMARAGLWINVGSAVVITAWMLTWGQWTLP